MDYTIAPLSEHTGVEVRGIDLTEAIDEVARARLNRAFVDHSVLVFRDQHLTPQQLLEAVGRFGRVFPQPQHQYRHQWRPGDLVMWDNRSLLHKANGDYDMNRLRYLYRVMLPGDVPV